MTISGSFTSPKVSIDLEALARNAAKGAAEEAVSKLFGIDTDNSEKTDSASTKTDKKKEAVKDIFNKAKGLFK